MNIIKITINMQIGYIINITMGHRVILNKLICMEFNLL